MAITLGQLGRKKAIAQFADWTDRIAAGELPSAKPQRPQGVERNVVISMWEWSTPKAYLHDEISTDKRNPRVNANGLIYGSPEESSDMVPVLNPITNETWFIKHPYRDPDTPSSLDYPHGHSIYWDDQPIWDGHTTIHNPNSTRRDAFGLLLVYVTRIIIRTTARRGPIFPRPRPCRWIPRRANSRRTIRNRQVSLIDTCFGTQHLYFGHDANNTLWTSAGGPEAAWSAG